MRTVAEIRLESVTLTRGHGVSRPSSHGVAVSLHWPRPMIALRDTVKVVRLTKGVADLAQADWMDRILFKETIEGTFGLEFAITEVVKSPKMLAFLAHMGSGLAKLAGSELADLASTSVVGGLAKLPAQYLAKELAALPKNPPRLLGVGRISLEPGKDWARGQTHQVTINLTAPADRYRMKRVRRQGRTSTRREIIVRKGEAVGHVPAR